MRRKKRVQKGNPKVDQIGNPLSVDLGQIP